MQQKIIDEIKDYLFDYLEDSSDGISELIVAKKFDVIINDAVKSCYDKAVLLGGLAGASVLATGLLHYLLTRALITSQRKIEYRYDEHDAVIHSNSSACNSDASCSNNHKDDDDEEEGNIILLDIVIPDLKTLKKDSKKSLVLCIPDTADVKIIAQLVARLETIQPEPQNIWLVLPTENISVKNRSYVIAKNNNTFAKIIFDISQFTSVNQQSQFKILKI